MIRVLYVRPIVTGCTVEWEWDEFMKGFQFIVWKISKNSVFLNYLIHDSDAFIVVFEADRPVMNNWEDFHRNEIKQSVFFILDLLLEQLSMRGPSDSFWCFR